MEIPFVFGKIASEKNFTDRTYETEHLISNFNAHINTILLSPRRWGKSSLVKKAAFHAAETNKNLRFCFIDLFNVRTEEEFYQSLAQEVLRMSSTRMEETLGHAKRYLGQLIPKISFSPDPNSEISLGLNWQEVKKQPDEILDMAENIAKDKNLDYIICIDEFQNVTGLGDSVNIQKKLRSHWQQHTHVSYCIYGSKRHMLMDVFTSPDMPFYKFGDLLFLQKIPEPEMISFIEERFFATGKFINREGAELIVKIADNHPYYVQQIAQQSWIRSHKTCTEEIINNVHQTIILQLDLLFRKITGDLNNYQLNFLKAILSGAEQLSSKKVLGEFPMGTSANIIRIKKTLENKEIIDCSDVQIAITDPLYKYWLKNNYFRIGNGSLF